VKQILLSFDTEEFDVPKDYGVAFSLEEGMKASIEGTGMILDILEEAGIKATFFCTGNFVVNAPQVMKRIVDQGHEAACHGVDHWRPEPTDFKESKMILERETGVRAYGYRQPRMFSVDDSEIAAAGYIYNTSLNPAFIPGHYMHLSTPRTYFMKDNVLQIPASVSPLMRIPLFWLALHNFPEWFYLALVRRVIRRDGYFATYFHPWEFLELNSHPEWKMPFIIRNNSGRMMCRRLAWLIEELKKDGCEFSTYKDFALEIRKKI